MFPFVETIKILNGHPQNLRYHQRRLDFVFESYFLQESRFRLKTIVNIPDKFAEGLVKLRFLYGIENCKLEFSKYEPRRVNTLRMIRNDSIRYSFKFTDRSQINDLFEQRKQDDDILIVQNRCITDTSIANIVFDTGAELVTPDTPLLKGTCRANLLDAGIIKERRIELTDLKFFIIVLFPSMKHSNLGISNLSLCIAFSGNPE